MSEAAGAPMRDLRGYLTPEEVKRLIDHARNFRDLVILRLLWATGCRVSELLTITMEDISWRDEAIAIWTLKRKKQRRFQRLVSVDKRTLSIVKKYCQKNGIEKGPLFTITRRRVGQIVREAGRAAGINKVGRKRIHPHHLRHSHCVAFIRENPTLEGLRKLQQRVGHASITTTAHYLQYAAVEARPEVESVFGAW
jgi:integrase/recombinase XerD